MSINKHKFSNCDLYVDIEDTSAECVSLSVDPKANGDFTLNKEDVIAIAKHFKLTAHDLNCQTMCKTNCKAIRNMQDEMDMADEIAWDECAELRTKVAKLNQKLTMKKAN